MVTFVSGFLVTLAVFPMVVVIRVIHTTTLVNLDYICLILLYDITIDKIVQVDFLSSSWLLSAGLVKPLFIETPFTFSNGEVLN
jgi:hypothetical protein